MKAFKSPLGILLICSYLAGCGGGGDGADNPSTGSTGTNLNAVTTNPNAALSELLTQSTTTTRWESTTSTPTGYSATVLAYASNDALYGKQGSLIGPNRVTTVQLQIRDKSTVLIGKYLYQIYVDKTTGGVVGAVGVYNDSKTLIPCINRNSQTAVPTLAKSGDSGAIIEGLIDFYEATFRSGTYAHYCQYTLPPAPLTARLGWSFETVSSKNYFCIVDTILKANDPLVKFCIGVDDKGKLNQSMRAYAYSQGAVFLEFSN
jgi:hypothetical protein